MLLTKEQQQELQIIDLKMRLNQSITQNLQHTNNNLASLWDENMAKFTKELREKEDKPEDKFNVVFDPNTFDINFTEKE